MSAAAQPDRRVLEAFYGRFVSLRPMQEAAVTPLLIGQNVVLSAGTGTGKTEAVMAPLVSRFVRAALEGDSLAILYIAPTKALVNDLEKRLTLPLQYLGLRVGVRHGDRDDLVSGFVPHVLITTPESLNVLLFRREPAIATVRAVVLDEVHLLYNSQRGVQLSSLLEQLRQRLPSGYQWAALSATIGRPEDVRDFLFGPEEQAVFLQYPSDRPIDARIRGVDSEVSLWHLFQRLTVGRRTKLLVFANARRECERLAGALQDGDPLGIPVYAHYSSLSPEVRVETEKAFAASPSAVCIATSTLELGIDIGDIDAVLLWGVPSGVDSFLQRIGRGNRRARKSNVVCLVPDDSEHRVCDALRFMALVDAARKGEIAACRPYDLFGAVGQQCLSTIASAGGQYTRTADLCQLFAHQPYLGREEIDSVLAELTQQGYLQHHGFKNQYGADEKLYALVDYRLIYGNFGARSQMVDVSFRTKTLGSVPAINLLRVRSGNVVRFAGRSWCVRRTSHDGISVEPAEGQSADASFIYPGPSRGFDPFLADRMWQIIHAGESSDGLIMSPLRAEVSSAIANLRAVCSADEIPCVTTVSGVRYLTFGGYLVNRAVALYSGQTAFGADDLSLTVATPIQWSAIPEEPEDFSPVFSLLPEADAEQSIYQALLPSRLQERELLQRWLKDATVSRVLTRLRSSRPKSIPANVCEAIVPNARARRPS